MLVTGSLRARMYGSFNYTCMIVILRETRTAVREWACWYSRQRKEKCGNNGVKFLTI